MRTYNNLYSQVYDFDNLYRSYLNARKCKRFKSYVLDFSWDVESELLKLQADLQNKTYSHGEYYDFTLYDAKKREIKAAPFRDRVVHHSLCNIIEPIIDRSFIYDSYACRKGKGTHRAVKRLDQFIRSSESLWGEGGVYVLKGDISKYFNSIDHSILKKILARKFKDADLAWLMEQVVDSSSDYSWGRDLFDYRKVSIPIGNLTSQLFANLYLNEFDQFVKHKLRVRYYLRYMDDFLVLSDEKAFLHDLEVVFRGFLRDELKLELHPKKVNVFPVESGVGFLGYVVYRDYKRIRGSTVKRFLRKLEGKEGDERYASLRSWLSFAKLVGPGVLGL